MNSIGFIQIFKKRSGGVVYRNQVVEALSKDFDVELIDLEAKKLKKNRYLKIPELFFYLFRLQGKKDIWIRDFYSTVFLDKRKTTGKNISLIFHVDFSQFPKISRLPFTVLEKLFFYHKLKKIDAIVVISSYWEKFFKDRGYKNVYKVYCGFPLEKFDISNETVAAFKKKYHLDGKPIVYLGNCQKAKGVVESYYRLKDLNVHFVTSGNPEVVLPAVNINGGYEEYLTLLKASSVAITMSRFKEGWCMTAHESMLLRTPVIGSGLGGMKELLEGGRQMVSDFTKLRAKVEFLLKNKKEAEIMAEYGYEYAKEFTMERFNSSWKNLVKSIA